MGGGYGEQGDLGEELKENQRRLRRGAIEDGEPAAKRRKVDVKGG